MRLAACLLSALVIGEGLALAQVPPPPPPPNAPRDAQPQQQKVGTAILSGRVLSAESGKPLRRAQVRAGGNDPREGRTVSTDADGRWQMKQIPAGRYTISVSKGGYVGLSYGQKRPFEQGKPVEVADRQVIEKLDVNLPKGSVITGRIADEFGEPLAGMRVSAMRYRYLSGQRRLMNVNATGSSDTTDDIGQYRLHGLSPGDYFVVATFGLGIALEKSDDRTGYAPTYYPGTTTVSDAQRVTLGEAQEAASIGFALAPIRIASISGTAVNSDGKPLGNTMVMLTSPSMTSGSPLSSAGLSKPDGTFVLSNVTPGDYVLQTISAADLESVANSGRPASMRLQEVAIMPITVTGSDITGLSLITGPTGIARGRVVFEGGMPPGVTPAGVMMVAAPMSLDAMPFGGNARVRDDWTFEMSGLWGKRLIRGLPPAGWYLKSIVLNGTDVTDTPLEVKPGEEVKGLEVTLTRQMASLTGSVQTAKGQPTTDYVVVLFASDASKWGTQTRFVRTVRPDQSGNFLAKGLPGGEYLAVALEYLEPGEEGDPEVLERLRAPGTSVTLGDGEAKTLNLRIK